MVISSNSWHSIIKDNRQNRHMASKTASQTVKHVGIKSAELRTNTHFKRRLLVTGAIVLGVGVLGGKALAQDKPVAQEPKKDNVELAAATEAKQDTTFYRDEYGKYYYGSNGNKVHVFEPDAPSGRRDDTPWYKKFVEENSADARKRTNECNQLIQEIRNGRVLTHSEIDDLISRGLVLPNDLAASVSSLESERDRDNRGALRTGGHDPITLSNMACLNLAIAIKTQNPSYTPPTK